MSHVKQVRVGDDVFDVLVYEKPNMDLLYRLGQRYRMHFFNCPKHPNPDIFEYFYGPTAFNLDFYKEHPMEILRELKCSKYIPYSCLMILINGACKCRTRTLKQILKNIRRNPFLRYKSKLIISIYCLKDVYHPKKGAKPISIMDRLLENYSSTVGSYLFPPLEKFNGGDVNVLPALNDFTHNDRSFCRDHLIFNSANMENTLFIQIFVPEYKDMVCNIDIMMYILDRQPLISLNELLTENSFSHEFIAESSTNADLYVYTINPALAIIINNYYFTNATGMRQGSQQDVRRLIRKLKVERIPFILLQDCNRNEMLQIMEYVEKTNFAPLKSLMFFLMTHGHLNDVVYTHDGQLDFKRDVVQRIQSNVSLENAEILVVKNSCRGDFDAEDDIEDDVSFNKTDNDFLNDNTVVMYSVPESVASPRDAKTGTPFIQRFCKYFRHMSDHKGIRSIKNYIDKDLISTDDYYYYLQEAPTELVAKDDDQDHCILTRPIKVKRMIDLAETLMDTFPTLVEHENDESNNSESIKTKFCICGSLGRREIDNVKFVDEYFDEQLDRDQCDSDVEKE